MAYMPRGVAQQLEFQKALNGLAPWPPGTEVVRWEYQLGEDWNDNDAIYFTIVLSDQATTRERLGEVASRIRSFIVDKVDPQGQWDFLPHFRFISQSDDEQLTRDAIR
jgi:hypothetical protein